MLALGASKAKFTNQSVVRSALLMLLNGGMAAVGTLPQRPLARSEHFESDARRECGVDGGTGHGPCSVGGQGHGTRTRESAPTTAPASRVEP